MILAGVFRLCTCIADDFPGEPGRIHRREYRSDGQSRLPDH